MFGQTLAHIREIEKRGNPHILQLGFIANPGVEQDLRGPYRPSRQYDLFDGGQDSGRA